MTSDDWKKLTRHRRLPDEARQPIEAELDIYNRFAKAAGQPPSATRTNLARAAKLASKLLDAIESFGADEHYALVKFDSRTPQLDSHKLTVDQIGRLSALRDRLTFAATRIRKGKKDATNQRALLNRVNQVVVAQTGRPLSKAKKDLLFAYKLGELARPAIGPGAIREAIENLKPKSASKKMANSG